MDTGGFRLSFRQLYGGHDGRAYAHHQSYAGEKHQQGDADVDGGDAVAADAVAYVDAVYGCDGRHTEHAHEGGDEILFEQRKHVDGS